jgi:hypothetical protein
VPRRVLAFTVAVLIPVACVSRTLDATPDLTTCTQIDSAEAFAHTPKLSQITQKPVATYNPPDPSVNCSGFKANETPDYRPLCSGLDAGLQTPVSSYWSGCRPFSVAFEEPELWPAPEVAAWSVPPEQNHGRPLLAGANQLPFGSGVTFPRLLIHFNTGWGFTGQAYELVVPPLPPALRIEARYNEAKIWNFWDADGDGLLDIVLPGLPDTEAGMVRVYRGRAKP